MSALQQAVNDNIHSLNPVAWNKLITIAKRAGHLDRDADYPPPRNQLLDAGDQVVMATATTKVVFVRATSKVNELLMSLKLGRVSVLYLVTTGMFTDANKERIDQFSSVHGIVVVALSMQRLMSISVNPKECGLSSAVAPAEGRRLLAAWGKMLSGDDEPLPLARLRHIKPTDPGALGHPAGTILQQLLPDGNHGDQMFGCHTYGVVQPSGEYRK